MNLRIAFSLVVAGTGLCLVAERSARAQLAADDTRALARAIASPTRAAAHVARDRYRHPAETLSYFGVHPGHTVVEIWPGGGWYTEILAPYLASGGGKLILATMDGELGGLTKLRDAIPADYARVTTATFPAFDGKATGVPDGSADVVLTFRNVHNWRMGYKRDDKQDYSALAFRQAYAMLKPGGTLGIVDHRLPESASDERERNSGYIKVSTVRRLAKEAGFREVASSEINANPRDTTEWPKGVWTLPPALRMGDVDREKYLAVGESDRMTLKFVKPR